MKKEKFKVSWSKKSVDEINIKEQVFLALSDKRYLNLLSCNAKNLVINSMSFDQYKKFLKKNKMYTKLDSYVLGAKKMAQLKKDKAKKAEPKTKNRQALKQALKLLNACYIINRNVKQKAYDYKECKYCKGSGCEICDYIGGYTSVDYSLRDEEYRQKTKIIKKVISLIRDNLLPIKYGKNDDGVIYFEYLNNQVSFHDPKDNISNCKKFDGSWTGVKNTTIPFKFV